MVLVVLVKSHILADVVSVLRSSAHGPFALLASLQSQDVFAFVKLYVMLSEGPSLRRIAEEAASKGVPHMFVTRRKLPKPSRPHPPHFFFECAEVILPGDCCIVICADETLARVSTIAPQWVREKLGGPEKRAISLIALNAYVSTLGGGHFLCKHVKDAWAMALRQQAIALALGDDELAGQCRVHLAYICMQMGRLKAAQRRLEAEHKFAEHIGSDKLLSVVHAAEVYLSKLKVKAKELRHAPKEKTRDGLYRQRFVQLSNYE